jgi:hypothetical protein
MRMLNALVTVVLGVVCGIALAIGVLFACSATVGGPENTGLAVAIAVGTMLAGGIGGALVAYSLWQRSGPKVKPPII